MNRLSKKLRELETNIAPIHIKKGTSRLSSECMSDAEQEIHSVAASILKRLKAKAERASEMLEHNPSANVDISELQLSPEQQTIVDTSNRLFAERVMELFDNGVAQYIHLNDPINKFIFYSRLNWFLTEMGEWLFLRWQEDQIYADPDFFDICHGEQEKRLQPVYSKWRRWLTEESWLKYSEENCKMKELPELTDEQIEEDAKLVASENAAEEANEAKFLKEKCPACPEKCKWFYSHGEK
ncbi:MAG TPA: hypothetical protein ENN36_07625 [Candidatus Bathyarchaeota archaeon]|nr:hypothetical protein [Candidatus Bathyarchaeota archaeon]